MKKFKHLLVALTMAALTVFASGCSDGGLVQWWEQLTCEHSYAAVEVKEAATCTELGEMKYACTFCGDEKLGKIPMVDHTPELVEEKAPSCTENGWKSYVACGVCETPLTEKVELMATGHTIEVIPGREPTCTEMGLTDGEKCNVCGEILVEQEEIPTAHKSEVIPGKEPTCTETGLTDGEKCSVCGEILLGQEELPVTPHSYRIASDEENHWLICDCGDKRFETAHNFMNGELCYDETDHWLVCACGTKSETEAHDFVNGEICYGETDHWLVCACGAKSETEAHDFVNGEIDYDETDHWLVCVCGAKSETEAHVYEWKSDEINHWKECTCGAIEENSQAIHTVGPENIIDCIQWSETQHWAICPDCGYDKLGLEDHVVADVYTTEGNKHWKECSILYCGQKFEEAEHVFDDELDVVCDCGYTRVSYTEVDVTVGETVAGNVYRIYRKDEVAVYMFLDNIIYSGPERYEQVAYSFTACASCTDYWAMDGFPIFTLNEFTVFFYEEYIDLYIESGTYTVEGSLVEGSDISITITGETTISSLAHAEFIKRLVVVEE